MLWQRLWGSTDFQLNSLADLFFGAWQRGRVADFPLVKLFIDGLGGVVSFVAILAATPVETRKHEYSKQTTVWSQSSCGGIVMQHFKRQVKLNFLRGPVFGLINSIGIWLSWCVWPVICQSSFQCEILQNNGMLDKFPTCLMTGQPVSILPHFRV